MKSLFQDQIVFSILIFSHVLLRAALEDQQEDTKKSDRFGMSWFETDNWLSDPLPPAPVGPPAQRPQVIRPPAPLDQARAPAPLDQGRPPAPLVKPPAPIQNFHQKGELESVTRGGVHAEDIHCIRSNGVTLLSAVVIPPPEYTSQPVFEDAVGPNYSPADCAMRPNEGSNGQPRRSSFAMHVQHFNKCGVRVQQGSDGKEWISVTLRFPYMDGLRMAEDEYVMIMCKPQDRIATTHHVMDIRPTSTEIRTSNKPRPVFRSGPRDVSCRMSLMTRGQGSRTFNKEMKTGSVVRVGQELQIRGQVREGDGWNYAMLKDVLITRVLNKNRGLDANNIDALENAVYRDPRPVDPAHDVAQLVFGDGCRNPLYRPVAPLHPQRDPKNPLMVSFAFRAFMFQDMLDGETLRISAQVVACADISDCQQNNLYNILQEHLAPEEGVMYTNIIKQKNEVDADVFCSSDGHRTLGRVKRSAEVNVSSAFDQHHHVQNFTEDFQLTVTLGGFSKTPIMSENAEVDIKPTSIFADCKLILISVSSAALLFCLVTTASAAIAIGSKRKSVVSPSRDEERKLKHKSDCCKRRN